MRHSLSLVIAIFVSLCCGLAACSDEAKETKQQDAATYRSAAISPPMAALQKRVAVSHNFVLRLPAGEVEQVQRRHIDACVKVDCTVLTSQLSRADNGYVTASLSLRIPAAAFESFAALLAGPPATVITHGEAAEDKTLAVLDVEKRLDIKRALRDRLQAMLKDPGKASVADLVAIESQLAQVQSEIESSVAQQDYLRTLTETIKVDITYQGIVAAAGGIDLSPINNAWHNVGRTLANSVASLISFVVSVLPWLPVGALAIWGTARVWRRWRRSRAP